MTSALTNALAALRDGISRPLRWREALTEIQHQLDHFVQWKDAQDAQLTEIRHQLDGLVQWKEAQDSQLTDIRHQLDRLIHLNHGGRATYVGNNRVLTKCVIADAVIGYLVEADDRLLAPWLILSGQYENDVTNFFLRHLKLGSRCIDVGANFGFYTCLMGRFCPNGKVIGVEPDPVVYTLVRDNIYINGLHGHASAKQCAISDVAGSLQLHRRITRSGNTSVSVMPKELLDLMGEPNSEPFEVTCVSIDDLLPEFGNRIDFLKIDVEGAEPLVLRGAAKAIRLNPQLNIIMEWSPGQISAAGFEIAEFLRELDAMGLKAAEIGPSEEREIAHSDLLEIEYRAGILLRRAGD